MAQTEQPHSRGAIIADIACVIAEVSDLQVRQAQIAERTAALQSRLGRMVRDLAESRQPADLAEIGGRLAKADQGIDGLIEEARDLGKRIAAAATPGALPAQAAPAAAVTEPKFEARVSRREPEAPKPSAAPSPAAAPSEPAKPYVRTSDRVRDDYAQTGDEPALIAARVNSTPNSVRTFLADGRRANDARVLAGDRKRDARIVATTRPPSAQGTAKPIEAKSKPAIPGERPAPPPMKPTLVPTRIPDGLVLFVKVDEGEVHGPCGVWKPGPETAKAFGLMSDGKLRGLDVMAKHGGLDPKVCIGLIAMWTKDLAAIGIRLVHTPGIGLKLNLLEASA